MCTHFVLIMSLWLHVTDSVPTRTYLKGKRSSKYKLEDVLKTESLGSAADDWLSLSCVHLQIFRAIANNMEMLNFASNFYVYCLCSSEIRRTFFQLFGGIFSKKTNQSSPDTSLITSKITKISLDATRVWRAPSGPNTISVNKITDDEVIIDGCNGCCNWCDRWWKVDESV